MVTRGGSTTTATAKTELFVIIVNGFQSLTIITKCSILNVGAVLDLPLVTGQHMKAEGQDQVTTGICLQCSFICYFFPLLADRHHHLIAVTYFFP